MSGCPFGGDQQPPADAHSDASVASPETSDGDTRRLSRRGLLGLAGVGGAGAVAGIAAGLLGHDAIAAAAAPPAANDSVIPFFGDRQAGITTAAQDRLHMAAFDVTTEDRAALIELLKDWTAAAEAMTAGRTTGATGAVDGPYDAPPEDTGEALDLDARRLTLTIGFGASLFEKDGKARFGLDGKRPDALIDLPHFPGDALEPARTGGDIVVQACADDPQVAVHAIRNLARIGFGRASVRWSQLGFGRTSSTSTAQSTPRNLFGFKDGTANLKAEETATIDEHVWVPKGADDAADWLAGGSYLVARRINMTIETWDRQSLREQEAVIGRTKAEGAPLSGGSEFSEPDFALLGRGDLPLIPKNSHVALVHPDANGGAQMLRRGYNFVDGSTGLGRLDAGLFFLAYVIDPRTHFIPVQTKIGIGDAMSEYLQHTGSALFAVPPGVRLGEYVGQALFS